MVHADAWFFGGTFLTLCELSLLLIAAILYRSLLHVGKRGVVGTQYQFRIFLFRILIFQLIVRCVNFVMVVVYDQLDVENLAANVFLRFSADGGTALFCLVYSALLLIWMAFIKAVQGDATMMSKRDSYILFFQVVLGFFFLSDVVISTTCAAGGFFIAQLYWTMVGYIGTGITLTTESILFVYVGYTLYRTLSSRNLPFSDLSLRSKEIALVASVVTIVFLFWSVVLFLAVVHILTDKVQELKELPQNERGIVFSYKYYNTPLLYVLFYFIGEIVPISLLLWFQSRFPTKRSQSELGPEMEVINQQEFLPSGISETTLTTATTDEEYGSMLRNSIFKE